ncbi:hypothetical protein PP175_05495 [Aneurinibacillus sp. Ricciae_BoGa-3]|nr:hypothetical protein [Aneurinibacillus sp. Ricciae_BoGa-3]WCK55406.1 hypothetical protein PP175_05495 [Aneurinibacillus sp. Ricciae_BoGa-3]
MSEKRKRRGPAPVIIPKKVADWVKNTTTVGKVNSWKVGGAHSYNERK